MLMVILMLVLVMMMMMMLMLMSTRSESPRASTDCSKFLFYSCAGWGLPTMCTTAIAILQYLLPRSSGFNPNVGLRKCWLYRNNAIDLFYFYIPVAILLLLNVAIFVVIVISLVVAKRKTRGARESSRRGGGEGGESASRVTSDTIEQLVGLQNHSQWS